MAITEVALIDEDFSFGDRKRTYTASYRVLSDASIGSRAALEGAQLVSLPDTVPLLFSTYSLLGDADANSFCQDMSCKRQKAADRTRFQVDVSWTPIDGDEDDDSDTDSNPLLRPVRYSGDWEEVQVPIEEAWNLDALTGLTPSRAVDTLGPITNAAGVVPGSPFMRTIRLPVLVAKKNYATLDEIWVIGADFTDSVNDATFKGRPAGEALYRGIDSGEQQYAGGRAYYEGTHRIAFYGGGWKVSLVNRGFASLVSGVLTAIKVKNAAGKEVAPSEPQNLKLDGTRQTDGVLGTVIDYRTSPEADFDTLGI